MTRYRITHITTYSYDAPVSGSYGQFHLRPRDLGWQQCDRHDLQIAPGPADLFRHTDAYGNVKSYFHVVEPHEELVITATSEVDVSAPSLDPGTVSLPWEACQPGEDATDPQAWRAVDFTFPSRLVDIPAGVESYARTSFTPGRGLGEALLDLMHRVHADFTYESGSTTVSTRVGELLQTRRGVCQDFTHFMVAGLRGLGLAGRYVSGYLATRPKPGRERLVGADASHAWVGCWAPNLGWLYVDPTNNRAIDESHATVAWGRDYSDVTPVKGVIFTEAKTSTMKVSVDMAPLEKI